MAMSGPQQHTDQALQDQDGGGANQEDIAAAAAVREDVINELKIFSGISIF